MAARPNVPILPIRTRVLFPNCLLQLNIGRRNTVALVEGRVLDDTGSFKKNTLIGIFTMKQPKTESENQSLDQVVGSTEEPKHYYEVGTLARVTHFRVAHDGSPGPVTRSIKSNVAYKYILLVQGMRRIRIQRVAAYSPFVLAEIDVLPPLSLPKEPVDWSTRAVHQLKVQFEQVIELLKSVGKPLVKRAQYLLNNLQSENVLELADIIASIVEASVEERIAVLSCGSAQKRLSMVNNLLQRQIELFKVSQEVQDTVQQNLDGSRRKFYLREQLKAIKKELGEDEAAEANEVNELEENLKALALPEEVSKVVMKDLHRLKRMQPAQPEYNVILSYLEFVLTLPWNSGARTIPTPASSELESESVSTTASTHGDAFESTGTDEGDLVTKGSKKSDEEMVEDEDALPVDESALSAAEASDLDLDSEMDPDDDVGAEIDLDRARQVLDDDHFGLEIVKKRVLQYLAVCSLRQEVAGPILCLVGPPGVGKTSLGKSIATAMRRKFYRLCLGGVRDEAEIRGHRRTYIGALPGQVLQAFARAGTRRPVILLDEIDKLGRDARGDPAAALLEVLDPAQNGTFKDHYLAAPFDISKALFIATANDLGQIPRPLLDRMEVIELPSYSMDEKLMIARRHLLPKLEKSHGLAPESVDITTEALRTVVSEYTQEAGVRTLERKVAAVCRHVALEQASADSPSDGDGVRPATLQVTKAMLPDILGRCQFASSLHVGTGYDVMVPGVALGLAWTPFGGELLTIETAKMPGHGRIVLTGRLGETMQESAKIALAWIRSHAELLGLDMAQGTTDQVAPTSRPSTSENVEGVESSAAGRNIMDGTDVHIHFPAGAIPKDGPSAGVAMTAALVSLLVDQPLPTDVAMTGEISLSGNVLPVGGIKEKVIAAHVAGCRMVIVPHRNGGDLAEVPSDTQAGLSVVTANRIEDVLEVLFGRLPLEPSLSGRKRVPFRPEVRDVMDDDALGSLSPVHIGRQDAVAGVDSACIPFRSAL